MQAATKEPNAGPKVPGPRASHGRSLAAGLVVLLAAAFAGPAVAQRRSPAEELVERERIRTQVQQIFDLYYAPTESGGLRNDNMNRAMDQLVEMGDAAIPYLIAEVERGLPANFQFVATALGRFSAPEAESALRAAIDRADGEIDDFGAAKKAWACYALAQLGHSDTVDLLSGGKQPVGYRGTHNDMSVLEAAAVFSAPGSAAALHRVFDRLFDTWDSREGLNEMTAVLSAMSRVGDPSSVSRIIRAAQDPDPRLRRIAAESLFVFDDDAATNALAEMLASEPLPVVRYSLAWALEQILPPEILPTVVERLKEDDDAVVRSVLYRILVRLQGPEALAGLRPHLGRPDAVDREGLIGALRLQKSPETFPIYRAALNDPNPKVIRQGVLGLAELGDRRSMDALIEQVGSRNWSAAYPSTRALAGARERRAAPAIAERVGRELSVNVSDPLDRERVYELGNALLALRYTPSREVLKTALLRQTDGNLRRYLENAVTLLAMIEANGNDVAAWEAAISSPDAAVRSLAVARLGEIGGVEAARVLTAAFGRVTPEEGKAILDSLAGVDAPASRQLVERVLTSEAFDPFERWDLRTMAAWTALRLGGPDMVEALRVAWMRRNGREGQLIPYLALAAGPRAIPWLEEQRLRRMRYMSWTRGHELETLTHIVTELEAGRPIDVFRVPPDRIDFRRESWHP